MEAASALSTVYGKLGIDIEMYKRIFALCKTGITYVAGVNSESILNLRFKMAEHWRF